MPLQVKPISRTDETKDVSDDEIAVKKDAPAFRDELDDILNADDISETVFDDPSKIIED